MKSRKYTAEVMLDMGMMLSGELRASGQEEPLGGGDLQAETDEKKQGRRLWTGRRAMLMVAGGRQEPGPQGSRSKGELNCVLV